MKYSKTTLMELSHRYSKILKKCALLNAFILTGTMVSFPVMAERSGSADFSGTISGIYSNGTEEGNGGAFLLGGNTIISNGTIFENNTAKRGGAIGNNVNNTTLDIKGASFIQNTGISRGGAIDSNKTGLTTTITNTKFNANISQGGGAIFYNAGTSLTIDGSSFENNTAQWWGALFSSSYVSNTTITNTVFKGNTAEEIGAVSLCSKNNILSNVSFIENGSTSTASNSDGSGALFLGAESQTDLESNSISGSQFIGNTSATNAGAIGTRKFEIGNNIGAKLSINNSTFYGNIAATQGGAFDNYFYGSTQNGHTDSVYIANSKFGGVNKEEGNSAQNGGAIYNHANATQTGNIYLTNTTFINNTATTQGGAIYNEGVITLAGTNIFNGNTAGGKANDIYNAGTLNISGNLTLDGGIVNTGDINFASGSQLKATLNNTTALISGGTVNGTTSLVVENGKTSATFKLFDKEQTFTLTNTLYTITNNNDGSYKITKKSNEQIVENLTSAGATVQEAATISAIASSTSDNAILKAISTAVQSGDVAQAAQAAKELAPTTSQQVMGVAQGVNNVLSNMTGNRMSAMGRAGGDAFIGGALWAQGLYNHTKQDDNASSDGFTANTRGLALGIDGKVNQAVTLGLGYGYTNTNADAGNTNVDVDGHNFFAYAQYQPNAWYINGMISYGLSKYTEEKAPMGIMMKSKYDVDTYSANLTTGYDLAGGITPYAGLRYILAKQDAYSDGAQYIKSDNNDLLTGILGAKYSADIKTKDFTFAPNIRLAATYDFISDNSVANVNIIGGGNYQITGERLKRFGVETGVGLETTYGDWNLSLDYNGSFKKDYQSHTGMLKAKYNF